MSEGQVAEGAMSAAQADHDAELREQVTVTWVGNILGC